MHIRGFELNDVIPYIVHVYACINIEFYVYTYNCLVVIFSQSGRIFLEQQL